MSMVELRNVCYSYKLDGQDLAILKNFNLTVEEGDFIAIQGPSGSGKSTLLYIIGGLLKLQSGQLILDDEDVTQYSNSRLAAFRNKKVGFVFQQFHLLAKTPVLQNILLPTQYPVETGELKKKKEERAIALASLFGLSDRLDHVPNQLSGGQQQRVAIARALINDPNLILADEPTGNLDSKSTEQILNVLKDLNAQGKTIIMITHDPEVAKQCSKIYHFKDGAITNSEEYDSEKHHSTRENASAVQTRDSNSSSFLNKSLETFFTYWRMGIALLPLAIENLKRNGGRSALTMLGVVMGIASVLAMVTLGQFTKQKILDSYTEMGAKTVKFYGYQNWSLKATDKVPVMFSSFNWERDLIPLKRVFPQVQAMSPFVSMWGGNVSFGGKTVDNDVRTVGVNEMGIPLLGRELLVGRNFSEFHISKKIGVCIIGYDIAEKLFLHTQPIGQVLHLSDRNNTSAGCRIVGVLKTASTNKEWGKPNMQVFLPYTFFQVIFARDKWSTRIDDVLLQIDKTEHIEQTSKEIRAYFELKYGKSGSFRVDSDSMLLAQMRKFLNLFTMMLAAIALISLTIGGIGITNMMLVSVSERFREIGLRKTLGATDLNIRVQFLVEAIVICAIAGAIGIFLGFATYQTIIFTASKFVTKLSFEWIIDWGALFLSLISIAVVGVVSGFFPALKAERLQVIEALRAD
jgi:macrolide transport system ATP-binding/permease protein